ncbi:phosphopantetheine-binding protein [Streptomyces sp. NPDC020412]|uniref:phosphopantetheine-binding protein n=1 Tax=Streptomyces sp. NPDC020412 TaxID=3365073 RepID=UPI0037A801EC
MQREEVLQDIHQIAKEFATSSGRTVNENSANFLDRYGFTSLDALEFLLLLEERFGVTFEDEDLTEETLTSEDKLADYIVERLS